MMSNLELILVLGTLITGVIALGWSISQRGRRESRRMPWFVDYARSFFPVLLVVLVLRSFVAEPFRIPSGSMMPTLLVGDFILVNKYAYGLRLPVTRQLVFPVGLPERGDVVVFKYPRNPREDYIKRVLGLPGDRVEFRDRLLLINGEPQPAEFARVFEGVGSGRSMTGAQVLIEQIGDRSHEILVWDQNPGLSGAVQVPEGYYFMVGDNRDNSNDSRMWGFVHEDLLVGRATLIWLNWDAPGSSRDFSRIGTRIR
jgi:signal peptidase I